LAYKRTAGAKAIVAYVEQRGLVRTKKTVVKPGK
jgi:hypothetical protein